MLKVACSYPVPFLWWSRLIYFCWPRLSEPRAACRWGITYLSPSSIDWRTSEDNGFYVGLRFSGPIAIASFYPAHLLRDDCAYYASSWSNFITLRGWVAVADWIDSPTLHLSSIVWSHWAKLRRVREFATLVISNFWLIWAGKLCLWWAELELGLAILLRYSLFFKCSCLECWKRMRLILSCSVSLDFCGFSRPNFWHDYFWELVSESIEA